MPLNSTYWAPIDVHDPVKVQQIMLGLTRTSSEKMDLALARDTKICKLAAIEKLYYPFSNEFSSCILDFNQDRLADIIHRGRDHGLPTYKQVREFCGLSPITTFRELNTTIDDHVIANLQRTYQVSSIKVTTDFWHS